MICLFTEIKFLVLHISCLTLFYCGSLAQLMPFMVNASRKATKNWQCNILSRNAIV